MIKGDIGTRLPDYVGKENNLVCALLLMHYGLYDTDRKVLETIWPLMPKGSVILLGSFGYHDEPQSTQVIDDVLGIDKIKILRFPFATKYCYIIK